MNTVVDSVVPAHPLHTKDYLTEFNTEAYLSAYTFFEMIPSFDQLIKEVVRIFIQNKQRLKHECALEFGGGPTLFSSFLLAQHVESIHFTDYTPSNLKAVEDWINQAEHAHDWTDLFEYIIREYQQQANKSIAFCFYIVFAFYPFCSQATKQRTYWSGNNN